MRRQKGHVYRKGNNWYIRYYDNLVQPDGSIQRKQVAKKIAHYPEYRSKQAVRELAAEHLEPFNKNRIRPESSMTLGQYWDIYWPDVQVTKRPATARSYSQVWERYLKNRCGQIRLRDFRTCDGSRILEEIDRAHHLTHNSLKRVKALLSAMFKSAKNKGVLDGINPVQDVAIPRGQENRETHAYTLPEIVKMLTVLSEPAATLVTTSAFAGLGESELRGLRWESYNGSEIEVRQVAWQGNIGNGTNLHVNPPKTAKRRGRVPVLPQLAKRLDTLREAQGNPAAGWVFPSAKNPDRPLNFSNLVNRAIKPTLQAAGVQWHGWHAFRRGLATNLYNLGVADKTVQAILRHADVATTMRYYVKSVPEDTLAAMEKFGQLVSNAIQ